MHKGIVSVDFLNIRISGSNRDESPLNLPLEKGEEVTITKALYGESLEDENVWYQLDSGEYVWAGGIEVDDDIHIASKKVIFTADDYGVVDSINLGITNAVTNGMLNSVTCFTNYGLNGSKSLANIRKLERLKSQKPLSLGVHLTVTSGNPILGRGAVRLLCRDQNKTERGYNESDFYDFTKLLNHYRFLSSSDKMLFQEQMFNELEAQIKVFTNPGDGGAPIQLDHLTSHHNSLLFHEDFFNVLLKLSNKFEVKMRNDRVPVPLRSLTNLPQWKDTGYYNTKGKVVFPKLNIAKLKRNLKRPENKSIKTVGLLHSNHFGPIPFILKKNIKRLIKKKHGLSDGMLRDLVRYDQESMEFLLHLRAGKLYRSHKPYKEETRATGYAGINPKSFDSRTAEYESFVKRFKKGTKLPAGIELGTWEDLY